MIDYGGDGETIPVAISAQHYREQKAALRRVEVTLDDALVQLAQAQSTIAILEATLRQMREDHAVAWPIARMALAWRERRGSDLGGAVDDLTESQRARLRGTA